MLLRALLPLRSGQRLPTIFTTLEAARAGALLSYGPNIPDLYRRAADYVDNFSGAPRSGRLLPVEQVPRNSTRINLEAAKALGIEVPNSMQLLADEVIE